MTFRRLHAGVLSERLAERINGLGEGGILIGCRSGFLLFLEEIDQPKFGGRPDGLSKDSAE